MAYIENCARSYDVWEYIDPDIVEPRQNHTPANPVDTNQEITNDVNNRYRFVLDRYVRVREALTDIDALLMQSLATSTLLQIQRMPTVHEKMRYIQMLFKPTDVEWRKVLTNRLHQLANPNLDNNLKTWAEQWITLAKEASAANLLDEVAFRDSSIDAASKLDQSFAASYRRVQHTDPQGMEFSLLTIV